MLFCQPAFRGKVKVMWKEFPAVMPTPTPFLLCYWQQLWKDVWFYSFIVSEEEEDLSWHAAITSGSGSSIFFLGLCLPEYSTRSPHNTFLSSGSCVVCDLVLRIQPPSLLLLLSCFVVLHFFVEPLKDHVDIFNSYWLSSFETLVQTTPFSKAFPPWIGYGGGGRSFHLVFP